MRAGALAGLMVLVAAGSAAAQSPGPAAPAAAQEPIIVGPPPPPATAMEAFQAMPGDILTVAYEDLGDVSGVFVEAREMRESGGRRVRGIVVTVPGRASGPEQAFIDRDEIAPLLKGFDALLAITTNPNGEFRNFDMRYSTRGELVLTASSTRQRGVVYGVEAGRMFRTRHALNGGEFHQLRVLVEAAQQKLASLRDDR
jgi:hypothetical protein